MGLRLHLRGQRRVPRRRAWYARRYVRACVQGTAARNILQGNSAPEPELAHILGSKGRILGYTIANDVSAWDIERENALYLPQSKVYNCCCALGPVIVTADSVEDPYLLEMTCTIARGGARIFSGSVSTARLHRKFEQLVEYLLRSNAVPAASVLLTGTGIIVTEESALLPGDRVTIAVPQIGVLSNPAIAV